MNFCWLKSKSAKYSLLCLLPPSRSSSNRNPAPSHKCSLHRFRRSTSEANCDHLEISECPTSSTGWRGWGREEASASSLRAAKGSSSVAAGKTTSTSYCPATEALLILWVVKFFIFVGIILFRIIKLVFVVLGTGKEENYYGEDRLKA